MKTSERSIRLATEVEESLPFILMSHTNPDTMGFVTIAGVLISGDLEVCDIFVRSFGQNPELAIEAFNSKSKRIAHELAKKVKTRRVMTLRFKLDKSAKFMKTF